jgi:HK97 gp10 family phage protein
MKVRIEGLAEVQEALRRLPDATAKNVVRRVLKKRAEPIVESAQARAPVLTGGLKQSIKSGGQLSRRARAGHRKADPNDIELHIGPAPMHAKAIAAEFGTFKDRPQPFMRPAWEGQKMGVIEGLKADLWAEIEKAAARLARKTARLAAKGR